jgi:hypothetical protein
MVAVRAHSIGISANGDSGYNPNLVEDREVQWPYANGPTTECSTTRLGLTGGGRRRSEWSSFLVRASGDILASHVLNLG